MKSAVILLLGLLALTADCIQESLEEDISLELEARDMSRHQQMIVKRKAVQIDKRGHKHDKKAEKETVSSGEKETVSSGEKETVSSGEKESVSSGEKESVSSGEKEKTVEKNVSVPPSVAPTGDVFPPPDPTYVSSSPMLPEFVDTVKELIDRLGKTTGLERDDVVSFLESMVSLKVEFRLFYEG